MNMMTPPPALPAFTWTPQIEDKLRELVGKGYSSTQIGRRLEVSRNAVIGKCKRLGLILGRDRPKAEKTQHYFYKWPEEAKDALRAMCEARMTCHEISLELTRRFGHDLSASAVYHRAKTMGLTTGGGMQTRVERDRLRNRSKKAAGPVSVALPEPTFECRRVSIIDLDFRSCRFPLGDPLEDDFAFCGNETVAGKSYCAGHTALCYRGE